MADIVITDIVGIEEYKSTVNMSAAPAQTQIALEGVRDGVYVIRIKNESNYYAHKLIIER